MSLQEGIYKATIQKVTLGETKTGKPQIVFEFITSSILFLTQWSSSPVGPSSRRMDLARAPHLDWAD